MFLQLGDVSSDLDRLLLACYTLNPKQAMKSPEAAHPNGRLSSDLAASFLQSALLPQPLGVWDLG